MAPESPPDLLIEGRPYRSNTFPPEASGDDDFDLEEDLRGAEVKGEPDNFCPLKSVRQLFTRERVLAQLKSYNTIANVDDYVDLICDDESTNDARPRYIKIFAILILIDKGDAICDFVHAGITDDALPFYRYDALPNAKRQSQLFLKDSVAPIQILKDWKPNKRAFFETTQWKLLVPYLELDSNSMVQEYRLSDRNILPWCKSKSGGAQSLEFSIATGAYGKVYCVDIHGDCHGFQNFLRTVQWCSTK